LEDRVVQTVIRTKPRLKVYARAYPVTALAPKDAQVNRRIAFAEAAKKAKGLKGLAPDGLPWAAHFVKEELSGKTAPKELKYVKKPKWLEELEKVKASMELLARICARAPPPYAKTPPKS